MRMKLTAIAQKARPVSLQMFVIFMFGNLIIFFSEYDSRQLKNKPARVGVLYGMLSVFLHFMTISLLKKLIEPWNASNHSLKTYIQVSYTTGEYFSSRAL